MFALGIEVDCHFLENFFAAVDTPSRLIHGAIFRSFELTAGHFLAWIMANARFDVVFGQRAEKCVAEADWRGIGDREREQKHN